MNAQIFGRIQGAQKIRIPLDRPETERLPRIDPIEFEAGVWQLCPYIVFLVGGGDCVIADGAGRPIVRVFADERIEILSPDAAINSIDRSPAFLHYDFGLPPGRQARKIIRAFIDTYQLAPELRRRRELLRRGKLTGGWGL